MTTITIENPTLDPVFLSLLAAFGFAFFFWCIFAGPSQVIQSLTKFVDFMVLGFARFIVFIVRRLQKNQSE